MARFWSVFRKSMLEQVRSGWELALVVLTPSLFVLLYWLFFGGGSTSYSLLVCNLDRGAQGEQVVAALRQVTYANGQPILRVSLVESQAAAEIRLRDRDASALLVLPEDFSRRLADGQTGLGSESAVILSGDLTNPTYSVAAILAASVVDEFQQAYTGQSNPVALVEQPLGGSGTRTEFETYVPGLLVVAMVMMVFSAAMRVTSEVESGGLKRLALTRVTPLEYLAGVSAVQMLVGLLTVLVTFGVAALLGFRSAGPLWLAIVIGTLTAFSVIGMGLMIAAYARTTSEALIFANLPLILMMFFSGGVFPLPRAVLFRIAGHGFAVFDILPQSHAVIALNKILTLGAGASSVRYEISMILILSLAYFALGVWLFGRRVMRR